MLRPRIIPCLLIHKGGLVKTERFINPKYVGDPLNAVRIFNEKKVDELMVLDIEATVKRVEPNFNLIAKLAAECRMPLCYGGGVKSAEHAVRLVDMGVEKVAVSSAALSVPHLITEMAESVGGQSVVAVLDVKKRKGLFSAQYEVYTHNGKVLQKKAPVDLVRQFQDAGVGELVINSIDMDGSMLGYDMELAAEIKKVVEVPLTILGGAGSLEDIAKLFDKFRLVGAAAGSLFVFKGKYRAVLINYPTLEQKSILYPDFINSKSV
jgi:imidazole glycerol-phosphate synthase subunit HisF